MLTIQQLIKALRKLQNNNTTAKTAVDLAKYLKNATATATISNANTSTTSTATTALAQQQLLSSLLSEQESKQNFGALHTINEQATEQAKSNETTATTPTTTKSKSTGSSQNFSHTPNSATFSQVLHETHEKVNADDEDSKVFATLEHLQSFFPSKLLKNQQQEYSTFHQNHHHQPHRSQQIQKFYQQQLLHFHTQQNSNLQTKQQQTQFAMSSLAAAVEPLAHKQQSEEDNSSSSTAATTAAAAKNADTSGSGTNSGSSNSSNSVGCPNDKSKDGAAPCFNTGFAEILKFMELIGNLKHTKRTGWVLRDVSDCESISGHMYRMSMMTFLLDGSEGLNQIRCMELALVHDLAESLVGDITPFCGVSKTDKRAMEFKAMDDICKLIEPRGKRIMELFEEYEEGESAESKFVKDLDRLDMVMQAFEYEKRDNCLLKHQEFFDSTEGKFNHPFVKKVIDEIVAQRNALAQAKGATPPPSIKVPDMDTENAPASARNGHCDGQQQTNSQSS